MKTSIQDKYQLVKTKLQDPEEFSTPACKHMLTTHAAVGLVSPSATVLSLSLHLCAAAELGLPMSNILEALQQLEDGVSDMPKPPIHDRIPPYME